MFCRTTISVLITIFVMHLCIVNAWAEDRVEAERVFGFAESLYEEGDYFRAIGEYKRSMYLAPTDSQAEMATFRIAEGYFQARRWAEAIIACDRFLSKYPSSSRYFEMLYFKGRVEKFSGRYEDSLRTFELITNANAPNYMDKAVYQRALVMLERTDWRGARDALRLISPGSPLFPAASLFAAEIEKKELPYKSPATAGVLAAVLPGAGHLYAERPRDALVAFVLNGAFIWGAVELFHHDNYVAGSVFAFFELGWYSGNIYSAVSSVHKYNRNKESDFIQKLKDNFSLALYRDGDVPTIIISHRF